MDTKAIGMVVGNEDLLLQILLCMPAKSLIKFKSVSRQWLSLIADPEFCSKHTLTIHTSLVSGMYFYYNQNAWPQQYKSFSVHGAEQKLPTLAFLEEAVPNCKPVILHACKGLFLCSLDERIENYAVCNLTARKFTLLPKHDLALSYESRKFACLVFEPSKSLHYKVVLVKKHHGIVRDSYAINIYSSERGSWECEYIQEQYIYGLQYKAVVDGAIHWMSYGLSHVRFELDARKLITYPMSTKPESVGRKDVCYFGECGGLLFLAYSTYRMSSRFIEVFAMDKNYIGWNLLYSVGIDTIKEYFPQSFPTHDSMVLMVCVVKEEEDDQNGDNFSLLFAIHGKIISYNLKSKKLRMIYASWDFQPCLHQIAYAYASSFMATLCPV